MTWCLTSKLWSVACSLRFTSDLARSRDCLSFWSPNRTFALFPSPSLIFQYVPVAHFIYISPFDSTISQPVALSSFIYKFFEAWSLFQHFSLNFTNAHFSTNFFTKFYNQYPSDTERHSAHQKQSCPDTMKFSFNPRLFLVNATFILKIILYLTDLVCNDLLTTTDRTLDS